MGAFLGVYFSLTLFSSYWNVTSSLLALTSPSCLNTLPKRLICSLSKLFPQLALN